jgi:hypothetical protein
MDAGWLQRSGLYDYTEVKLVSLEYQGLSSKYLRSVLLYDDSAHISKLAAPRVISMSNAG